MCLNFSFANSYTSECLQDKLTNESVEDKFWSHSLFKHQIYTKMIYLFTMDKSSQMKKSSPNITLASDNSSLV